MLTPEQAKHIIGVQANLWTEYIKTTAQVEYMIMPRIDALSEVQWTMPGKKNYDCFIQRLFRMMKLYDKEGYNYSKTLFDINPHINTNNENGMVALTLETIDQAPIYYTLDGTEPDANSHKYTGTLSFSESVQVRATAIRSNVKGTVYKQDFHINKATMKPIELNQEPHRSYTFKGTYTLVDGVKGNKKSYKDGSWLGFNKSDIEVIIDLKEKTEFSEVEVGTYICTGDWIFGAEGISVEVSGDGAVYTPVAEIKYPLPDKHVEEAVLNKLTFDPVSAIYVKIKINKVNKMPQFHSGAGSPAFIFIDEIRID